MPECGNEKADICLNTTFLNKDTTINVIVKLLVEYITNFDPKKVND